ncbi:hypothetical protein ABTQ07_20945, partial [Acinetobacter baumannii]
QTNIDNITTRARLNPTTSIACLLLFLKCSEMAIFVETPVPALEKSMNVLIIFKKYENSP